MGNDKLDDHHNGQLKLANDAMREDILPGFAKAYDDVGPAVVLTLGLLLADVWLESGFTAAQWRAIIDIYDLEAGVLRAR